MRALPEDRGAELLYVALGDSTVTGEGADDPANAYPARLERRLRAVYARARLVNLGVGGATAEDVMREQLDRGVALQPQLVTLSVGPNDIERGLTPDDYLGAVRAVFQRLIDATQAVIVANLIPDMSLARTYAPAEKPAINRLTVQFNHALESVARSADVELVDLYGPSRALGSGYGDRLSADGFHPSDLGYEKWAEFMWFGVEKRLAWTTAPPT